MKLKDFSYQFIKDLYTVKLQAVERNDEQAIAHLKSAYPELFCAHFMMDILCNYFKNGEKYNENTPFKTKLTTEH